MLNKVDEIKLLARCVLADDRDAFGALVRHYQKPVRRFLLNLTLGDTALADDLAQETFIKAYLNIRSFKSLSKFSTWLFRIAYNEYFSWLRKCREDLVNDAAITSSSDCYETAAGTDARIDIHAAMTVLSPAERSVTSLFYLDDLPIRKISAITGMPDGTVKSHLSRAKKKLEQFLNPNP